MYRKALSLLHSAQAAVALKEQPVHAYASMEYAETLDHVGFPLAVAAWHTPVLLRPIADTGGLVDAMGPYPVCVLPPDADIDAGLQSLRAAGVLSIVMVIDPFCGISDTKLARHFSICRRFKTHYILERSGSAMPSKHHRERIRRGERHVKARLVSLTDPLWQGHWRRLYGELIAYRGITGLQAFPPETFIRLAKLASNELLAFAAETSDGEVLAMQLWIRHGDCAYSHLTATSAVGYRLLATYVVYAAAIDYLADCRVLDFGGGAGAVDNPDDSLATFKQGFANAVRVTRLCGAILDPVAYESLAKDRSGSYFPLYRARAPGSDGDRHKEASLAINRCASTTLLQLPQAFNKAGTKLHVQV